MNAEWYIARDGKSHGPYTLEQIQAELSAGACTQGTLIWRKGFTNWQPLSLVPEFAGFSQPDSPADNVPPAPGFPYARHSHEIDYEIFGHEMQFVEIELDPGESAVAEAGAMMYMTDGIVMETVFGDGSAASESAGLLEKFLGAGKRLITGESLFCTVFTHKASGKGRVSFGAPYPGKIIPLDLRDYNGQILCQKDAFLCAAKGVAIGIAFQKRIGAALFGGEGFILQKLEGDGYCFIHAGGTIVEKELQSGEIMRVDTGCLAALTASVQYDIEFVGNVKSAIFGGEGFFYATLQGPGHVWLQSLPFSRLAGRIHEAAPQTGGRAQGEGSVLGGIGNLFQD